MKEDIKYKITTVRYNSGRMAYKIKRGIRKSILPWKREWTYVNGPIGGPKEFKKIEDAINYIEEDISNRIQSEYDIEYDVKSNINRYHINV